MSQIKHNVFINTTPEKIFKTITTQEGWDAWFTKGTTIDLKVGGYIRFKWENFGAQDATIEDGGEIIEIVENEKFSFLWYPIEKGTEVNFFLLKKGNGTVLQLVETGYSTSKEDIKALVECASGWGEALTLLKFYLEYGLTYDR